MYISLLFYRVLSWILIIAIAIIILIIKMIIIITTIILGYSWRRREVTAYRKDK